MVEISYPNDEVALAVEIGRREATVLRKLKDCRVWTNHADACYRNLDQIPREYDNDEGDAMLDDLADSGFVARLYEESMDGCGLHADYSITERGRKTGGSQSA